MSLLCAVHGGQPIAANLVGRESNAAAPNERWIGDTTELLIPGGRLFLAVIVDLYSRFVVGRALSAVNDRHLTIRALDMALRRRCPDAGLLHHSDRGAPTPARTTRPSSRPTASLAARVGAVTATTTPRWRAGSAR